MDDVRRAVVFRAGALGDLVLLRRAVASLRRAGASVTVIAPSAAGTALVGPDPDLAQALVPWERADVARCFARTDAATPPELAAPFDVAICYSRQPEIAQTLATFATQVIVHDPTPEPGEPAAVWLARPVAALGLPIAEPRVLRPTADEEAAALAWRRLLPEHFLAVHPGSGSPRKNWPVERFAALVSATAEGERWLLVLGPADDGHGLASLPGAVLARDLPLRVLGALVSQAGLFVGNDSGVSHWVAAWGAPVVALFGPTDPLVWAPVGRRVAVVRSEDGRMESIGVDEVRRAATTSGVREPRSR